VTDIVLIVVAAVLAITLHEAAHGYAAWALGDDTARRMGRLSLNPLRHIDRVGTILLPGFLLISQWLTIGRVLFMFGWAKPVPVAAWKFPNPRRGMMIVAAAGPGMNFLLAWLGALSLHALPYASAESADLLETFVGYFIAYNLILGLFNLLPIPPLDGGRIMVGLLPEAAALQWAKLERAGIAIVLLALFLLPAMSQQLFHVEFDPLRSGLNAILPRAMALVEWLAGLGPGLANV
jgi:Zn-dependent protease